MGSATAFFPLCFSCSFSLASIELVSGSQPDVGPHEEQAWAAVGFCVGVDPFLDDVRVDLGVLWVEDAQCFFAVSFDVGHAAGVGGDQGSEAFSQVEGPSGFSGGGEGAVEEEGLWVSALGGCQGDFRTFSCASLGASGFSLHCSEMR